MAEVVSFDEIEVGDHIRVTHVLGRRSEYGFGFDGVHRTVTAVVAEKALDKVWLEAGGHVVAHRGWKELRIVRLNDSLSI